MIKFVLNRGLSRPLFYSRVPAMEHLRDGDGKQDKDSQSRDWRRYSVSA